ncbi:hypothetical protein Tsubulata_713111 [Turnera subulata]|uniref:Receptor-like serine/threonine-protein kinase n=1 Tax=Turnera subulata TaxID=218843 RepID=A0A9Q0FBD2_9ROSI|nr:hypothetical protein Tsubulata_713111 [Turnera subulata]
MNPTKGCLVSLLQFLLLQVCLSRDTLSANESLADGDILVSSGQRITLGFFSPGNSSKRYVGIWFSNSSVSVQTVVWVANRDNPINDTSGVLSIDSHGYLVLFANNQTIPLWSTNLTVPSTSNSMAQLLDIANLVLVRQDTKVVTWQSFDHPTNNLLPYSKIGIDYRTGLNRILTSWKSQDDPGTGDWSLKYEPEGSPEMVLYKGQVRLWRSGPWDGDKWNGVPQMSRNTLFNASLVNNNEETTFTWGLINSSIFSIMFVDESGFLIRATWINNQWVKLYTAPEEPCDNYGRCGAFGICNPYTAAGVFICSCVPGFQPKNPNDWNVLRDGTGGCFRNPGALTCRNGEEFVKIANAKVPDTSVAIVDMSLDLKACRLNCLGNCSCMAYALANESSGVGCTAWYGDLVDTRVFTDGGLDLFVRVDAATFGRQRHPELVEDNSSALVRFGDSSNDEFDDSLPSIDVNAIISATKNFSLDNKLGQGGFGSVYKGQLASGQEIAVKRLSKTSRQGTEEFKNEVKLMSKLQHKNLVRLYGCCVHREEKMLVYEFLPNRSLDFFIFDRTRRSLLDWKKRFEIIMGIARGLLYLHQDSRLKIIHRDLKPSNVLLDAAMNPKISDFGMAKIFGDDQTEANTERVVGTYGYMSPEYALEGLYSIKSDVFSYGVLMLEIISGRKNNDYHNEGPSRNLIGHVWELWRKGTALDIADTLLGQTYPPHEVQKCIQVGLLCVQEDPVERPTMSAIVFMLGNETTLPPPSKPAFILKKKQSNLDSSTTRSASSINDASITNIEAR